jgi:glutamyl-tRNA reductase
MPTSLPLHLVGVSHHTAGLEVREQLVLTSEQIGEWLQRERRAQRSLVVLATCNRLELYWWGDDDQESNLRALARAQGLTLDSRIVYRRDGLPAVRHLFLVASGLDSQVLGEYEILGQVRRAHAQARAAGTTTWELDAAFAAAMAAGRRVRRETPLGRHPGSVGSAAVAQAALCCGGSLAGRAVLVLGAGELADGVLGALEAQACRSVVVLNRTSERADALVASRAADTASWDSLPEVLAEVDVAVAATAAPHPVLNASLLAEALRSRSGRPLVVLDLAIPRNVDPPARDVPGVRLFDLDDLRLEHCPAASRTSPAIEEAEALLRDAVSRFRRSLRIRAAAPHLAELHRLGERLAQEEADRTLAELESLSESEREVVRQMADRLVRRLLYPASRKIRESL